MFHTIAFILGREDALSLAELIARYGETSFRGSDGKIAFFDLPDFQKYEFHQLGGSIRAIRVLRPIAITDFRDAVVADIQEKYPPTSEGEESQKIRFAIGAYGRDFSQFESGMHIKKMLGNAGIASRLVNRVNENIVSAVFKEEKLGRSETEYVLLTFRGETFFGVTLACQDIDSYTRRDMGKTRDMDIGMLPPKLAQMMINIARDTTYGSIEKGIYDPFIGLGTVAIEAMHMGVGKILGSDIQNDMVSLAQKNGSAFLAKEKAWQETIKSRGNTPKKDTDSMRFRVFSLDSRHISEKFPTEENLDEYAIVSEGYLGEIMRKEDISLEKIRKERKKIESLYRDFFYGLRQMAFPNLIVMTFPFWNIRESSYFFTELDAILRDNSFETIPLLPNTHTGLTARGTLLHKRPGQQVGREIWRGRLQKSHE